MNVVRANYDTLTLRVFFETEIMHIYQEQPDQTFFDNLLVAVVRQSRKNVVEAALDMQTSFHELSVIS
ncbi:unnamed protein product [Protopolystoma xenopodis]|uniref:Uncharacterized protein n=1 Tax=Protopolystoma xenopodis TaxID=117903 RepID=A0A3S5BXT9_9PLAT|nr:unnamed protein product [Protopolystoma xenopodis]